VQGVWLPACANYYVPQCMNGETSYHSKESSLSNTWAPAGQHIPVLVAVICTPMPIVPAHTGFVACAQQGNVWEPSCNDGCIPKCTSPDNDVIRESGSWCGDSEMDYPSKEHSQSSAWSIADESTQAGDSAEEEECNLSFRMENADIKRLEEQLNAGSFTVVKSAVNQIRGDVWAFAHHRLGCRIVQLALDVLDKRGDKRGKEELAMGMKGNVWKATKSRHANYVLQKIIEVLPPTQIRFVAEELLQVASQVARHTYGCRILSRLVEHATGETAMDTLLDQLLGTVAEVRNLAKHHNGNYVLRSILEHGLPKYRVFIARAMQGELVRFAKQKYASHVVQAAMIHCDDQTRLSLTSELWQDQRVNELETHPCGRHILDELKRSRFQEF